MNYKRWGVRMLNSYCEQCLYYKDSCPGIEQYSMETTGQLHCFEEKPVDERKANIRRLEKRLENTRWKIEQLQREENQLVEQLETI